MSEASSDPPAESPTDPGTGPPAGPVGCPPLAERSPEASGDTRAELLHLADALARTRSHRLLIEYLRLRRSLRTHD